MAFGPLRGAGQMYSRGILMSVGNATALQPI